MDGTDWIGWIGCIDWIEWIGWIALSSRLGPVGWDPWAGTRGLGPVGLERKPSLIKFDPFRSHLIQKSWPCLFS